MKVHTDRKDRRSSNQHIKEHDSSQLAEFVCDEDSCGKVYTSQKSLRNHKRMKHNEENEEISCDICLSSFRKSDIAEHLRVHI